MKGWQRAVASLVAIGVVVLAIIFASGGRDDSAADVTDSIPLDPGYAARDAEVIETGYDGRERYRLKASVIRQQTEAGVISLENLEMNYTIGEEPARPGEKPVPAKGSGEIWHLTSDRGEVRANGDDVQLNGNVRVTGPAPGTGEPLSLTTESMRINTPTEFIETNAQVKLRWSGHEINALGMQADLKAGKLSLESDVNGHFFPK